MVKKIYRTYSYEIQFFGRLLLSDITETDVTLTSNEKKAKRFTEDELVKVKKKIEKLGLLPRTFSAIAYTTHHYVEEEND